MAWSSVANIRGPEGIAGPPGPSEVSSNAGNLATLGSDDLIYVPSADLPRIKFVLVPPPEP